MGKQSRWRGLTPKEEWEALSERLNAYIDLNKINSEKDYYDELERVFSTIPRPTDGVVPSWFPRRHYTDISENNKTLQKRLEDVEKETLTALQQAQRFHASRSRRSRLQDEKTTAKNTKMATRRNVRGWIRQKGRKSDIKGVDTRIAKRLATRNLITRADLRLKNFKVTLNIRGVKQYRDLKGRFVKRPYKRS